MKPAADGMQVTPYFTLRDDVKVISQLCTLYNQYPDPRSVCGGGTGLFLGFSAGPS